MSMRDPHYRPTLQNPFTTLPRLREGKKIMGSSRDLFSSCFELPSPARVATPTQELYRTSSLVNLDQNQVGSSMLTCSMLNGAPTSTEAVMRTRFEDHLFHGRVELLKRLYSGGVWTTQDDSVLSSSSGIVYGTTMCVKKKFVKLKYIDFLKISPQENSSAPEEVHNC